jgi:hypothetical protein
MYMYINFTNIYFVLFMQYFLILNYMCFTKNKLVLALFLNQVSYSPPSKFIQPPQQYSK